MGNDEMMGRIITTGYQDRQPHGRGCRACMDAFMASPDKRKVVILFIDGPEIINRIIVR